MTGTQRPPTLREQQLEEVEALFHYGASAYEVGQALGVSCRALQKTCYELDRHDLAPLFTDEVRHERNAVEARTKQKVA